LKHWACLLISLECPIGCDRHSVKDKVHGIGTHEWTMVLEALGLLVLVFRTLVHVRMDANRLIEKNNQPIT
jgi:hypothetical protein